jgi:hypothetical protein
MVRFREHSRRLSLPPCDTIVFELSACREIQPELAAMTDRSRPLEVCQQPVKHVRVAWEIHMKYSRVVVELKMKAIHILPRQNGIVCDVLLIAIAGQEEKLCRCINQTGPQSSSADLGQPECQGRIPSLHTHQRWGNTGAAETGQSRCSKSPIPPPASFRHHGIVCASVVCLRTRR